MGGGGGKVKTKTPKVETVEMPSAPVPAPPPEPTAMTPVAAENEGSIRRKDREAKKRGTGALRIDLNIPPASASSVGGAGGGLNIPKG